MAAGGHRMIGSNSKPMKKFFLSALFVCYLVLSLIACSSVKNDSDATTSDTSEPVELTPEFIHAIRKYDYLGEFSEGLAPVGIIDNKKETLLWGYINTKGEEAIPCKIQADGIGCFSDGMACIEKHGYYSFIDRTGKTVISIDRPEGYLHEEGFVGAITKEYAPCYKNGECVLWYANNKIVYLGKGGLVLREETREDYYPERTNGKYLLFHEGESYNNTGLKDEEGNIIIPAIYDDIYGDGENGIFLVTIADVNNGEEIPDWYVGYVDMKGNDTFPEQLIMKIQRQQDIAMETSQYDDSQISDDYNNNPLNVTGIIPIYKSIRVDDEIRYSYDRICIQTLDGELTYDDQQVEKYIDRYKSFFFMAYMIAKEGIKIAPYLREHLMEVVSNLPLNNSYPQNVREHANKIYYDYKDRTECMTVYKRGYGFVEFAFERIRGIYGEPVVKCFKVYRDRNTGRLMLGISYQQ